VAQPASPGRCCAPSRKGEACLALEAILTGRLLKRAVEDARAREVAAILMSPLTMAGPVGYVLFTDDQRFMMAGDRMLFVVPGLFIGAAIFGATVRPYSRIVERELPVVREAGHADADEAQRSRSVA
jgi:hypothetical protein